MAAASLPLPPEPPLSPPPLSNVRSLGSPPHLGSPLGASMKASGLDGRSSGDETACVRALRKSQEIARNLENEKQQQAAEFGEEKQRMSGTILALSEEKARLEAELSAARLSLDRTLTEAQQSCAERQRLQQQNAIFNDELDTLRRKLATSEKKHTEELLSHTQAKHRMETSAEKLRAGMDKAERDYAHLDGQLRALRKTEKELVQLVRPLMTERQSLLKFLTDLLVCLQELFYDPTPFFSPSLSHRHPRSLRSARSSPLLPRQPCSRTPPPPGGGGGAAGALALSASLATAPRGNLTRSCEGGAPPPHSRRRLEVRQAGELSELIDSLEVEIHSASLQLQEILDRVRGEADRTGKVLALCPTPTAETLYSVLVEIDRRVDFAGDEVGGSKRRPHGGGGREMDVTEGSPRDGRKGRAPCMGTKIDWAKERQFFHALTQVIETKFSQLVKLQRAIHGRRSNRTT